MHTQNKTSFINFLSTGRVSGKPAYSNDFVVLFLTLFILKATIIITTRLAFGDELWDDNDLTSIVYEVVDAKGFLLIISHILSGIYFAYSVTKYNIWTSIVMHAVNNLLAYGLLWAVVVQ